MTAGAEAERGWVGSEIEEQFPELGLTYLPATVGNKEDRWFVKRRMRVLEEYFSGAIAISLPARPVTSAYRVFYRQIGLNPDVDRTPLELIVRQRLSRGRFVPRSLLEDALTVAAVETEIPVWAIRAADVLGPLGITTSRDGERLDREEGHEDPAPSRTERGMARLRGDGVPGGGEASEAEDVDRGALSAGTLVVADAVRPLAVLFAREQDPTPHRPTKADRDVILYAITVPGIPQATVEEALWLASTTLGQQGEEDDEEA